VLLPDRATAASWLETSDADFIDGDFLGGTGFETELHGTGAGAYIQNKQDIGNWVERFPPSDPGPRKSFGFTNNSFGNTFVLFGGVDAGSTVRNDTWEYDYGSNAWTRICADDTKACAPPRRFGPSMAYDNNSKVAVMYGGMAADYATQLTDTWEFYVTNNTWVNRTAMIQPQRLGYHAMTYDPVVKQVILVGRGLGGMEVWAYSAATHTWQQKPSIGPAPRSGFALAYNHQINHRRVVLYGGAEVMQQYDDTWEYDTQANTWRSISTDMKPPSGAGAKTAYVFTSSIQGIVLWGGSFASNQTFRYRWDQYDPDDPFSWKANWKLVFTPSVPSPLRKDHGLAYDPAHDAIIMFGGSDFSGSTLSDMWTIKFSFRLEGRYISNMFNTYQTLTHWDKIFWNQTPANVPPNTLIRFQVNVSNECNDSAIAMWSPYFTAPGQSIGADGFKCIKYLADMITYDSSVAPRMEDVAITYSVKQLPPMVSSYSPSLFNIPVNAPIMINFTTPMNTANVWVSMVPNVTFVTPWTWYEGNTKVKILHSSPFLQGQKYDLCVWGTDASGATLNYSTGKFCWSFSTVAIPPHVVSTLPKHDDVGVKLPHLIIIMFSTVMDTGTCWPYITASPYIPMEWGWDASATELTGYHNNTDFQEITTYTYDLPVGDPSRPCKSAAGSDLIPDGVPERWYFTTEAVSPYIVRTDPPYQFPFVDVSKTVNVTFSREMMNESLSYEFKNIATGLNWSGTFTTTWTSSSSLSFSHAAPFDACTPYQMHVWALDLTGRSLVNNVNAPNPWQFMTSGPSSCPPFMVKTRPSDGDKEVPVDMNITLIWWGDVDHSSLNVSVKDQYGGEFSHLMTPEWNPMGDIVTLTHFVRYSEFPFNTCMNYTVTVLAAKDHMGRDFIPGTAKNPFTFSTVSTECAPILIGTVPVGGAKDVPLDQNIILRFSQPMNTSSLEFLLLPDAGPLGFSWSENDTEVTVSHSQLVACQLYRVGGWALGKNGLPLAYGPVENPFNFTAVCMKGPEIYSTIPAAYQNDVTWTWRIIVNFSEPIDTASLNFTITPWAGTLTYLWSDFDQTLAVFHSMPFEDCEFSEVRVRATNKTGAPLVAGHVPNPWRFKAKCAPPYIVNTTPLDNALAVSIGDPITIVFSEPVVRSTLDFNLTPWVPLSAFWQNDRTVRLTHTQPFLVCKRYFAQVYNVKDFQYMDLVKGPVPNPWNFTTDCRFPLRGLQVHRAPPNDVMLTWTASPGVTHYKVFHATDRFAPWPWAEIADVTATSVTIGGHLSDMQNHFYIVKGYNLTQESLNSTMGALWHLSVSPNVGRPSGLWFSLPYNSIYRKASDIVRELGEHKINVVAKWDAATQKLVIYYYIEGWWRGQDFSIKSGEGLMMGIVSPFDWAVNGTDSADPLSFIYRPQLRWNFFWISLPLTGAMRDACQLVTSIEGGCGSGNNVNIVKVGKWIYSSQSSVIFAYGPLGWSGTNFSINPGDVVWVEIVSTFTWAPELITPEMP
jgi:hypothetical protein